MSYSSPPPAPPPPRSPGPLDGAHRAAGGAHRRRARRARRRRLGRLDRRLGAAAGLAQAERPGPASARCSPPTARASASSRPTSCASPSRRAAPDVLKQATVAIEDQRFYKHKGVDYEGIVRAAVKNITSHKTVQGGSTITMQLVRNLYTGQPHARGIAGYQRKIREAKLAEELEQRALQGVDPRPVPQHRALRHRGRADRGRRRRGRAHLLRQARQAPHAARGGDARRPAAGAVRLLAGAAPARPRSSGATRCWPRWPQLRHDHARGRRAATMAKRLGLHMKRLLRASAASSYFFDYVKDELIKQYGLATVQLGGLKVYTTIDLKMQREARGAIATAMGDIGPVVGDRHDRPAQRLHPSRWPRRPTTASEVQPRRAGPPPAGLVVQGLGADDRAAQGREPGHDALQVALADDINDPRYGPDQRQDLRRHAAAATSRCTRRRCSPTTRSTSSSRSTSAPTRSSRPRARWASRPSSTATRRRRWAASSTACRRSRWPTPTRRSPPAATATGRARSRKVTFPDGKSELPTRWRVNAHEGRSRTA